MSTAIAARKPSPKPAEPDARRRAQQSRDHPDCRAATIKPSHDKIALALSSRRDNHPLAATAKMATLIVAAFPSRLSRYIVFAHLNPAVSAFPEVAVGSACTST